MPGVLFVYSRPSSFVSIDRDALAESFEVREWQQGGAAVNLLRLAREVRRSDIVFGWFASWHTFWPLTLAWLLRRPSVLVTGGYDTARMPEIGYGLQYRRLLGPISRWVMRRATRLVTNSHYAAGELRAIPGVDSSKVTVVHHGIPDPFGALPGKPAERLALTVGIVDERNLDRKGLRPFVAAAALLPACGSSLVGRWDDAAVERLRAAAGPNVELTGWVEEAELRDWYRRAVRVRPALAARGLRHVGGRGDAGRLYAGGDGGRRPARGRGRGRGADRLRGARAKSRRGSNARSAWTTRPGGERGNGWSSTSRWPGGTRRCAGSWARRSRPAGASSPARQRAPRELGGRANTSRRSRSPGPLGHRVGDHRPRQHSEQRQHPITSPCRSRTLPYRDLAPCPDDRHRDDRQQRGRLGVQLALVQEDHERRDEQDATADAHQAADGSAEQADQYRRELVHHFTSRSTATPTSSAANSSDSVPPAEALLKRGAQHHAGHGRYPHQQALARVNVAVGALEGDPVDPRSR